MKVKLLKNLHVYDSEYYDWVIIKGKIYDAEIFDGRHYILSFINLRSQCEVSFKIPKEWGEVVNE